MATNHQTGMYKDKIIILNPWLYIWLRPRETMRCVVDNDADEQVILLVSLAGFAEVLVGASRLGAGDIVPLPVIFATAVILGPVLGIILLISVSFLLYQTGKWLDGAASYPAIRAAIAWSTLPLICFAVTWIPQYLLLGEIIFRSGTILIGSKAYYIVIAFTVLRLVLVIWSVVIFLICLSEVQKFSAGKALLNSMASLLILSITLFFIDAIIKVISA